MDQASKGEKRVQVESLQRLASNMSRAASTQVNQTPSLASQLIPTLFRMWISLSFGVSASTFGTPPFISNPIVLARRSIWML